MGGVVQKVMGKPAAVQAVAQAQEAEKPVQKVSQSQEEQAARMRGARRRGRQLLSDSRLNPEAGVETLGGGNSLG
jgi:lipopolysaccharide export system protein LptC